jgi:hypothetical protein
MKTSTLTNVPLQDPPDFEPKIPNGYAQITTGKPKTGDCALRYESGGGEWRVIEIKSENDHWMAIEDRHPIAADYICLIRPTKTTLKKSRRK